MASSNHDTYTKFSRNYNKFQIKLAAFLFPIALALIFLGIKIWSPETYELIVQEDTLIENAQALFYFLGSIGSFLIFIRLFKHRLPFHNVLYGLLAMGLLFISLEEISWGQRLFNIENTDYFNQHNMQEEITLHNLKTVAPLLSKLYILIGLYGTFGWLSASRMGLKRRLPLVKLFVPDWFISSYFFFVLFIYSVLSYIRPFAVDVLGIEELRIGHFFIFRDQEPAELLLSIGFMLFGVVKYFQLRKIEHVNKIWSTGFSDAKAGPKVKKAKSLDAA